MTPVPLKGSQLARITKGAGATSTERALRMLCDRSFLPMWSYAQPFRDTVPAPEEICDLLVVFDRHVIIFSDKQSKFPDTGEITTDWARWYRRTVEAGSRQVFGAERWLKQYPTRVFTDRKCQQPLPIQLPDPTTAKYHRIVVARGSGSACARYWGGRGSLLIDSRFVGTVRLNANSGPKQPQPFTIGFVDASRRFVHVLDDLTLGLLLQHLDTVADFTHYLEAKERLFEHTSGGTGVFSFGEEELLAWYFEYRGPDGRHCLHVPRGYDGISLGGGRWDRLLKSAAYASRKHANVVSYFWDGLIQDLSSLVLIGANENFVHSTLNTFSDYECILRVLAGEPRTARRILSHLLEGTIEESLPRDRFSRVVPSPSRDDVTYLFLALSPRMPVRTSRQFEILEGLSVFYMEMARREMSQAGTVIGLVTYLRPGMPRQWAFAYSDGPVSFDQEAERIFQETRDHLGAFKNTRTRFVEEKVSAHFPNPSLERPREPVAGKNPRNRACPCGSGLKFKKCCGKL